MEEISSQQYHVDILLFCQGHNLMEAFPAVISSYRIALHVAHMAIGCDEDADSVRSCILSVQQNLAKSKYMPVRAGMVLSCGVQVLYHGCAYACVQHTRFSGEDVTKWR